MRKINLARQLETIERAYIRQALEHTDGDKQKAAALLTMPRRRFYRRLERLALNDRIVRRPRSRA